MIVKIVEFTSSFAENKDSAQKIRKDLIIPSLKKNETVILDFEGVTSATQSFIHALVRQVIKEFGIEVLERLLFKNCNDKIKTILTIVIDYIQDA